MGSEHINIPRTKLDGKDPKNVPRGSYGISAQKCYLVKIEEWAKNIQRARCIRAPKRTRRDKGPYSAEMLCSMIP